jgi:hypothetical protein
VIPYSDFYGYECRVDALPYNIEYAVCLYTFFKFDAFYYIVIAQKGRDGKDYHHAKHHP